MVSKYGETPGADLAPKYFVDSNDVHVRDFARQSIGDVRDEREKAVRLFYAVRDGILYDPYSLTLDPADYRASAVLARGRAFCVPKSILLAAAARAVGIGAHLGFADVRNHLTSKRLFEAMRTDVFAFHGYTSLLVAGRWFKVTSAFNRSLCEKFGVRPQEFDGGSDALLHPYDLSGRRHMEYLRDRGEHDDFPFDDFVAAMREHYPHWFASATRLSGDFETEGRFEPDAPAGA
ncbi:MAG: transglutaminase family protein [Deltaproteobacteria bacterium]|nr:transglutaminase family protein [Deltaproteobacteria bacterium]